MTRHATDLLSEALRLPEGQRGELAARLIESLDPMAEEDEGSAWGAEIQQRIEELQRGEVHPVPWTEARRMIRDEADGPAEA